MPALPFPLPCSSPPTSPPSGTAFCPRDQVPAYEYWEPCQWDEVIDEEFLYENSDENVTILTDRYRGMRARVHACPSKAIGPFVSCRP